MEKSFLSEASMRPAKEIFYDRVERRTPLFVLRFVLDGDQARVEVAPMPNVRGMLGRLLACVACIGIPLAVPLWLHWYTTHTILSKLSLLCPGLLSLLGFLALYQTLRQCMQALSLAMRRFVVLQADATGTCSVIGGLQRTMRPTRLLRLKDIVRSKERFHHSETFVDVLLEDQDLNYALAWIMELEDTSKAERESFAALKAFAAHLGIPCVDGGGLQSS